MLESIPNEYYISIGLVIGYFASVLLTILPDKIKSYYRARRIRKTQKESELYYTRNPTHGYSFVESIHELRDYLKQQRPRTYTNQVDKPFKVLADMKVLNVPKIKLSKKKKYKVYIKYGENYE